MGTFHSFWAISFKLQAGKNNSTTKVVFAVFNLFSTKTSSTKIFVKLEKSFFINPRLCFCYEDYLFQILRSMKSDTFGSVGWFVLCRGRELSESEIHKTDENKDRY